MSAALRIVNLRKRFHTEEVLRGINLEVAGGEVVVLTGPNGSGKSTLLGAIVGTVACDGGQVEIAGVDLAKSPVQAREHLRYLAQELAAPPGLSGRDWLAFHADVFAATPIQRQQMEGFAALGPQLDHLLTTYSLGMRRRLALAGILAGTGSLFVLDEPFAGVDPEHRARFVEVLGKRVHAGAGLLLAAHAADEPGVVALTHTVSTRVVALEALQSPNSQALHAANDE